MKSQNQAILSIGSNQGNRLENIQQCIQLIQLELGTVFKVSKLYETPSWGFSYQFTLPADCLRVVTILNYDYDYKVEGRKVLANHGTVKIQYVARIEDPNQYDELLRETISASLAADIAYAVTSSNPTAANMYELFQSKLKEARFVDATEGYNTNPDNGQADIVGASSFINSRY